jgi:PBP1b-binding outer membrane lipoprotein LpoB
MKILTLIIVSILILSGCGKKSDPKYQGKLDKESKIIL